MFGIFEVSLRYLHDLSVFFTNKVFVFHGGLKKGWPWAGCIARLLNASELDWTQDRHRHIAHAGRHCNHGLIDRKQQNLELVVFEYSSFELNGSIVRLDS